jgi:hypothetical protein
MHEEPPITLGLTVPGTAGTDVDGRPIDIFRCPACKEYINTSMEKCRFCSAPVDASALKRAKLNQRIENVCNGAAATAKHWWVAPGLFWPLTVFNYFVWRDSFLKAFAPHFVRFLFVPIISLAAIGGLWCKTRALYGKDPAQDLALNGAEYDLRFSLWMWIFGFLAPPTIVFIARPDLIRPVVKVFWKFF